MSAPEVGDRVRVHGEPCRGQFGHVADPMLVASAHLWDVWVALDGDSGTPLGFDLSEVEKVSTSADSAPRSDEQGADVGMDPDAANGHQNGGKR